MTFTPRYEYYVNKRGLIYERRTIVGRKGEINMTKVQKLEEEIKNLKKELRKWRDHPFARAKHSSSCQCASCD